MTKAKAFLILQAALCILLVALLCASALTIYRDGAARRLANPLEPIYTREIVAAKIAPIVPLFFTVIVLSIAGWLLGVKDEREGKMVRDLRITRDLAVARVVHPSVAMRKARYAQRLLRSAGWGAFALCMLPVIIYLINPAHFPLEDLEGMIHALARTWLPWTVLGTGALATASALCDRCILREIEAAQEQVREERASGITPEVKAAPQARNMGALQIALFIAAIAFIVAGALNGSARDVLQKAIYICTECVGLG